MANNNIISDIEREIKQKEEIVEIAQNIRNKYDTLKKSKEDSFREINETFQPIIKPINDIRKIEELKNKKIEKEDPRLTSFLSN